MENTIFIKIEIITFLIAFSYFLYYILEKGYVMYFNVKKIITPVPPAKKSEKGKKIKVTKNKKSIQKNDRKISSSDKEKLAGIIKRAKTNLSKGYFDSARGLIIEGLAIDKYNKDLNLHLANIYEKEQKYKNAEFIYVDLLDVLGRDAGIMKKLGFIYALQHELEKSLVIYEKVHKKKKDDIEVLNMLSDLTFELHMYEKALKYVKVLLKDKPRNVDRLLMQAVCFENLEHFEQAFEVYKKIVELQPYNTLARNKLNELFSHKK
ncbi:MAG: hypothetical protein GY828_06970 [Candidatus Gracilibacteria bacterium]|nr:hypothetical protein [Candidatus Gracilibacteria bacterium]